MRTAAGSGVVQRFLTFLHAHDLVGTSLSLALSGGPDSTALAVAASEAARARLIRVRAIHVDHSVRPDSAGDLTILAEICRHLRFELTSVKADLPLDASEDEMRAERYRLLSLAAADQGGKVMTAHHADDQAETVLLHAIRGSGLEGIAGMAPVERRSDLEITVIRPFLQERRASLLDLVKDRGVPFLDDPTNADLTKSRNSMRLKVLPTLEQIHPGAASSLARLAEIARADDEALRLIAQQRVPTHIDGDTLVAPTLQTENVAVQRRILRSWVRTVTGMELTWNRTEALREAIASGQGGTMIELGEQWVATKEGQDVRLSRRTQVNEG